MPNGRYKGPYGKVRVVPGLEEAPDCGTGRKVPGRNIPGCNSSLQKRSPWNSERCLRQPAHLIRNPYSVFSRA